MSDSLKLPWRDALEVAVQRLADDQEHQRKLRVFVDFWGLENYTPPDDVEASVRNIILGVLACAAALSEEGSSHE